MKKIQSDLNKLGYALKVDGAWGSKSQAALEDAISKGLASIYIDFEQFKKALNIKLTQSMVDNINILFKEFNKGGSSSPLYIAYMLATTWHETAHTLKPIKEYGSWQYLSKYDTGRLARVLGNTPQADGDGQKYAGRGYVQITGKANYAKFSKILSLPLVEQPDLALQPDVAAKILVEGSMKGLFTGKKLSDYIKTGSISEYTQARRVINGTDRAQSIAKLALKILPCVQLKV